MWPSRSARELVEGAGYPIIGDMKPSEHLRHHRGCADAQLFAGALQATSASRRPRCMTAPERVRDYLFHILEAIDRVGE